MVNKYLNSITRKTTINLIIITTQIKIIQKYQQQIDLLPALLAIPHRLPAEHYCGRIRASKADPVAPVVPLELSDVRLAPRNLAPHACPRPRRGSPRPFHTNLLLLFLLLLIQFRARTRNPSRQEVLAGYPRIALPHPVGSRIGQL